jgi:hypothetical protein
VKNVSKGLTIADPHPPAKGPTSALSRHALEREQRRVKAQFRSFNRPHLILVAADITASDLTSLNSWRFFQVYCVLVG